MDWRAILFDWNHVRAFLVTAEEGSLSAAARALAMAQPTVGRQIAALEADLGVTLFERVGRGLQLTEAGTRLLVHVRAMGDAATAFSLAAGGQANTIEGHVAITASEIYAHWLMPQILPKLRAAAPGITVEIVASNAIRDLKRREADIAIRNAQPEGADLISKRIAEDKGAFFAAPAYLETLGAVTKPSDLSRAEFIGLDDMANFVAALQSLDVTTNAASFPLLTASHTLHWELARAGLGIAVGPCGLGDADPKLRRVLPDMAPLRYPVWLVAHRELRTSPRVRLVWDLLANTVPGLLRGGVRP